MAGFEQTEWIARQPEAVFQFITDTRNAPRVIPSVQRMEVMTVGPVGVGTRYRETRLVNGKQAQAELEVTGFEPPARYAVRNVTDAIETVYTYRFQPERDGTRGTLECAVSANGVKKLMVPMVVAVLKKEDGDHLARLKAAVETG
jgi:hypothetical protein